MPAELRMVRAGIQAHFGPRTWLAGRRLRSISAAAFRLVSTAAAAMSSRWFRLLRSLHLGPATTRSE